MKKSLLIITVFFSIISFRAFSQLKVVWDKTYSTNGMADQYLRCAIQNNEGNFLLFGESTNSQTTQVPLAPDPDGSYAHGGQDYTIIKTDPDGNVIWNNAIGGSSGDFAGQGSIIELSDGSYVMSGFTTSWDGDVNPATDPDGSGFHQVGDLSGLDIWVVKMNASGIVQWQNALGGAKNPGGVPATGEDRGREIIETQDGGLFVVGGTNTNNNGDINPATDPDGSGHHLNPADPYHSWDLWAVKLRANGTIEWQNTLGGKGADFGSSVVQANDGGYVITGYTGSVDGDATAATDVDGVGYADDVDHAGIYGGDLWVIKLDATGHLLWQNAIGGDWWDDGGKIIKVNGGYIVVGVTYSWNRDVSTATDVDGSGNHGGADYWVIKLDENGNVLWQNAIGSYYPYYNADVPASAYPTCDGGVIICGGSSTMLPNGDKTEPNKGSNNFWLVRIDGNGNILWDKTIGSACQMFPDLDGEAIPTKDGGYLLTGMSTNPPGGDKTAPYIYADWWVVKLEYGLLSAGFASDDTVCMGNPVIFTDTTFAENPLPALSYQWIFGDPASGLANTAYIQNPAHTFNTPGTYSVTLIAQKDCKFDTVIKAIVVKQIPPTTVTGNTEICYGDSTTLSASGGISYKWSTGETTSVITVSPLSNTQYSLTISNVCSDKDTVINILIQTLPNVTISGDTNLCYGNSTTLAASGGTSYIWSTGTTMSAITVSPTANTQYSLTISDACAHKDTAINITVQLSPVIDAGNDTAIFQGNSVTLNAGDNGTYSWSPTTGLSCTECPNPIATPMETTTYYVVVTSSNGCTATDYVTVEVLCTELFIPNVFSPNGDGLNDVLYLKGNCIKELEFKIFNRWGEIVFITTDLTKGWDGLNSEKLNSAVFAYKMRATMLNGTINEKAGSISLMK